MFTVCCLLYVLDVCLWFVCSLCGVGLLFVVGAVCSLLIFVICLLVVVRCFV